MKAIDTIFLNNITTWHLIQQQKPGFDITCYITYASTTLTSIPKILPNLRMKIE